MADISVEQKKGGDLSWIWAIAAILAIVGLMVWLFTAQPPEPQVAAVETAPQAETVALSSVAADPAGHEGREIRVESASVAAVLGNRAFWAEVPGANPFLVVLGAEVSDVDWLAAGATVTVEGIVQPVTEPALDAWVQGETIRAEARDEASFASHYLNVTQAEQ